MKVYIQKNYFLVTLIIFFIEILIAYFHFNNFIRGFVGDVLVILLLYSFLKIFIKKGVLKTALLVLCFACSVEMLQYSKVTEKLNISSEIILTIVGSVFDYYDLMAYGIGFLLILVFEKLIFKKSIL
ncbi:DUF2809 domain-containing protein [Aequorivita sp. Q41]|uniref:ribosomal maturation YjgA family protein n=1 Tax=Aequorivita sp. Q41 TaxID=3153300 RepID=UPI0032423D25